MFKVFNKRMCGKYIYLDGLDLRFDHMGAAELDDSFLVSAQQMCRARKAYSLIDPEVATAAPRLVMPDVAKLPSVALDLTVAPQLVVDPVETTEEPKLSKRERRLRDRAQRSTQEPEKAEPGDEPIEF